MTTAYVNVQPGEQILVKVSLDGGTTYNHPALINTTRGITFTLSANTDKVTDMNNPSNPSQTVRSADATDTKIDGEGMMDANSVLTYTQLAAAGTPVSIKYSMNFSNANAASVTVTGFYYLTSLQWTGETHKKATCSLTFEQASQVTVTSP